MTLALNHRQPLNGNNKEETVQKVVSPNELKESLNLNDLK